jgi:hypothetical protein
VIDFGAAGATTQVLLLQLCQIDSKANKAATLKMKN